MEEFVCHCFGHTASDIEADALAHGRSLILERIAFAKRAGGCDCAASHPLGR